MYSNLQPYVLDRKPPMGALLNPFLPINRGIEFYGIFWEGAGGIVEDLSGNGNIGTFQGTAPSWSVGKFGPAVLLPGTDEYISIANESNFDRNGGDLSVSVWVKTNHDYSGGPGFIVCKRANSMPFWHLRFNTNNTIGAQVGTDITHYRTSSTSNTYNDGVWHHVVMVFSDVGYIVKLYVDGVLDSNPGGVGNVGNYDNNAPVEIGSRSSGAGDFFNGLIDHVIIYNRALLVHQLLLSISEIALLHQEPFCGLRWSNIIQLSSYIAAAGIPILRRRRECA